MGRPLVACLCILALAFAGAALSIALDIHAIRVQVVASGARTETQTSGVLSRLDGLVAAGAAVVAKVDAAAVINLKIAQDTNARTRATAGETEKLVASSRRSAEHIESVTLPKVDRAVEDFSAQTKALVQSADKPLRSLATALDDFDSGQKQTFQLSDAALTSVRDLFADPAWKAIPKQLETTATEAAGTSTEVHESAILIHKALEPAKATFAAMVLRWVLNFGGGLVGKAAAAQIPQKVHGN